MEHFEFDKKFNDLLECSPIPFAIYQFINKRVVTCFLSQGFCDLFGLQHDEAMFLMDHDMYRDAHPEDVARIADAAYAFAVEEKPYDVVYRTKRLPSDDYFIVHAYGRHMETSQGRSIRRAACCLRMSSFRCWRKRDFCTVWISTW